MTAGRSLKDLDKIQERYRILIKNFIKSRKDGFNDFTMAGKGICPGCKECTPGRGHARKLPWEHAIGSMDCKTEAIIVGCFSEALGSWAQSATFSFAGPWAGQGEGEGGGEGGARAL